MPSDAGAPMPLAAWAGLVLLAAGVPLGGLVHRRRRRRALASSLSPAAVSGP